MAFKVRMARARPHASSSMPSPLSRSQSRMCRVAELNTKSPALSWARQLMMEDFQWSDILWVPRSDIMLDRCAISRGIERANNLGRSSAPQSSNVGYFYFRTESNKHRQGLVK